MSKFIVRLLYIPFFLIAGNGTAIYLVEQGYSKIWLLALIGGFISLAFFLEGMVPYDAAFNQSKGDSKRDFVHAVVNESLSVMGVLSVPLIATFITLPSLWPTSLPLWVQLVIAVFIADIGITLALAHYASHRIDVLWRLHAVHHSIERMYGFNGLMKHPLQGNARDLPTYTRRIYDHSFCANTGL